MGEQEDRLVSVHDVLGFLPDFDSLSDPPYCQIRFQADKHRLLPVNDVIFSKRQRITLRLLNAIATPSVVCLSSVCLSSVCDVGAPYSGG